VKRRNFCISALAAGAATLPLSRFAAAAGDDIAAMSGAGKQLTLSTTEVKDFAAGLRGQLLLPEQDGYEAARKVWNGAFDKRPALIARCAGAADVQRAVDFGRTHGLLLAVRGGGHSLSGQSTCDGGMMIDLSPMHSVQVDPLAKSARVEPGALLGDLDREAQAFGLATPAGTVSHTGVAGLTLGGGYGRLARKFGLTCDNLTAAEVITADGKFVRASGKENADLFWGLRGGGGNFGVVTSFTYQLHPVEPIVFGGALIFPATQAREVLKFWADYARAAPDDFYAEAILTRGPGGMPALVFDVCHCGPREQAERDLKPLRQAGKASVDALAPISYVDLQRSGDGTTPHGRSYYIKSGYMSRIEPALIDVGLELLATAPMAGFGLIMVHHGGAIARVKPGATAVPLRDPLHSVVLNTAWEGKADADKNVAWARDAWRKLEPLTNGYYVNTANADDPQKRVRDSYGMNYGRLAALKRKYDPANLFHLNANIRPA